MWELKVQNKFPWKLWPKIRDEVFDLPTLYTVDVVDFRSVDQDFLEVAKDKVESLTSTTPT